MPSFCYTTYHDHPDGTDRGGTLQECHSFSINNGRVVHEWDHDYPGDLGDFDIHEGDVEELRTKEDAEQFLQSHADELKRQYEEALARLELVKSATSYVDATERYPKPY